MEAGERAALVERDNFVVVHEGIDGVLAHPAEDAPVGHRERTRLGRRVAGLLYRGVGESLASGERVDDGDRCRSVVLVARDFALLEHGPRAVYPDEAEVAVKAPGVLEHDVIAAGREVTGAKDRDAPDASSCYQHV